DAVLVTAISDLIESQDKRDISLAAWEKLEFGRGGQLHALPPLRAAFALAESLQYQGCAHVDGGALLVSATNPIIQRVKDGKPTVLMDATPPKVIKEIVSGNGGKIINRIAKQQVNIIRHPQRFWGLGELDPRRTTSERVERAMHRYSALIELHGETNILVHNRAYDQLPESVQSDPRVGYWGADHRAHDRWSGKDLVLVGSFFPPESQWRNLYQSDRLAALAGGANPDEWPTWPESEDHVLGAWVCEGSHDVQSRLPLPQNAHIRAWLLDKVGNETVQAIGRARGVNAETELTIHVYGGVPVAGLHEHGLAVAEYHADASELGRTLAQVNGERHDAAMVSLDHAASRIVAKGRVITRHALADEMLATGTDGPQIPLYGQGNGPNTKPVQTPFSAETYRKWLDRIQKTCPALFAHMSQNGRGASVVRAMMEASRQYGQESIKYAVEMTEGLIKHGHGADDRFEVIEELEAQIREVDCPPETKALYTVFDAASSKHLHSIPNT
ncbi:hypothetical protein B1757_04705, partial [Acidithiobacillus marinus]